MLRKCLKNFQKKSLLHKKAIHIKIKIPFRQIYKNPQIQIEKIKE
jgi:hypothetical protein